MHGFVQYLRDQINKELVATDTNKSVAKDFDEYRFMIGKRLGLQRALAILDDAVKKIDEAS